MSDWTLIDVNVSIGHWPFRRTPGGGVAETVRRLRSVGTVSAWVGSLEGLFDRDISGVNGRLAEDCRGVGDFLMPFGSLDPTLPDWKEDLRRCAEVHRFRGIRLHPGFRGFEPTRSEFQECLGLAAERGLVVQVVGSMEDERTQNPVFRVPPVSLESLPELIAPIPNLKLVLLNVFRKLAPPLAARLAESGKVWFDIAMLEGVDRVGSLVAEVGPRCMLFGSHFPLFVPESARLKLQESELPGPLLEQIARGNAGMLLNGQPGS